MKNNRGPYVLSVAPLDYLNVFKGLYKAIKNNNTENIVGYCIIVIIIIAGFSLVLGILTTEKFWTTNKDVSPDEIITRVSQRGLITSTITAIIFGFVNGIMTVRANVSTPTYQALIGMIVGGLLGFVLDNAFATEKGASIFNGNSNSPQIENLGESLKYGFASLATPKLPRYIITIILDIFISLIMTDTIIKYSKNWYFLRKHSSLNDILTMAFVSFATFLAYTNATRLQYAYPPTDTTYSTFEYIPTIVILLSSIIAGIVFLIWEPFDKKAVGIVEKSNKVILIAILFVVIVVSYYNDWLNPKPEQQIINTVEEGKIVETVIENKKEDGKSASGIALYVVISIILAAITMYTAPPNQIFTFNWFFLFFICLLFILFPTFLTTV